MPQLPLEPLLTLHSLPRTPSAIVFTRLAILFHPIAAPKLPLDTFLVVHPTSHPS